jgi:hypothetical protein
MTERPWLRSHGVAALGGPGRGGASRRFTEVSVAVLWLPWLVVTAGVLVTYSWVAPGDLYHVSGSGISGGLSRALVLLNFPIALAALPVIALSADRLRASRLAVATAIVAAALCLVVVAPGVVDEGDLDWRPVNILPAVGVALAVALGVRSGLFRDRIPVRPAAAGVTAVTLLLSLPWIVAEWGFYLDAVPVLGWLFFTGTFVDGSAAVHLGHHHGMDGTLLFLSALPLVPLSRRVSGPFLRGVVSGYTGLQLAYGLANAVQDGWGEQIWKRGWVDTQIPSLLHPDLSASWLGIALAGSLSTAIIARSGEPVVSRPVVAPGIQDRRVSP